MTDRPSITSMSWTVVHGCPMVDGAVSDTMVLDQKRREGYQWMRCYRCEYRIRLVVQAPDGKVIDRFDDGRDLPEWASPRTSTDA